MEILNTLMTDYKINQKQLANNLELSAPLISMYLNNKRQLSVKTINKIKEVYNIDYNTIMKVGKP
jgi:transcriptional regulator with XRE-family HTH domain